MSGEDVLIIPRASIMDDPGWLGVRADNLAGFEELVAHEGRFMARSDMEVDRSWKQVIPYLVLRGPFDRLARFWIRRHPNHRKDSTP